MMPQPPDLLELVATDHRRREAVAAAERLRGRHGLRRGAASLLRGVAERLSPSPSVPAVEADSSVAARTS